VSRLRDGRSLASTGCLPLQMERMLWEIRWTYSPLATLQLLGVDLDFELIMLVDLPGYLEIRMTLIFVQKHVLYKPSLLNFLV